MRIKFPTIEEVRAALEALSPAEVRRVALLSGVPLPTLLHIRAGETLNPGIETVRAFWPWVPKPAGGVA